MMAPERRGDIARRTAIIAAVSVLSLTMEVWGFLATPAGELPEVSYTTLHAVVPLVFAVILFRLHQYIVFGGAFGQYHLQGLRVYLTAFLIRWAGVAGALVVVAVLSRIFCDRQLLISAV